jgi:pimeloyl-ACP methyl ester carboxylesterase
MEQAIQFCAAPDGARIGYAVAGKGPPLVKTGNWFTHLEFDWQSPVWRHVLEGLAEHRQLIRYDVRGTGMSDREVRDISFEHFVTDLGAVVDAMGLERFPLLGISQGGAVSIAYAARNPDRVSHLVLLGAYSRGAAHRPGQGESIVETERAVIRNGWGNEDPAYRQLFGAQFIPDGTPEQISWFGELERVSASPEVASRIFDAVQRLDVRALLPQVKVPTLILHARGDRRVPFEMGCELAALIPGARFMALDSKNHLILEHEPATEVFFREVSQFLGDARPRSWKRRSRSIETGLQSFMGRVEASPAYKLLAILAVVTSIVSFVAWLAV